LIYLKQYQTDPCFFFAWNKQNRKEHIGYFISLQPEQTNKQTTQHNTKEKETTTTTDGL
jgi:hypothetical protein